MKQNGFRPGTPLYNPALPDRERAKWLLSQLTTEEVIEIPVVYPEHTE